MKVVIREYKDSDRQFLVRSLEGLVDYLAQLDPIKRTRRLPAFGRNYTNMLLNKVKCQNGIVFIADVDGNAVGCIAGVVQKQSAEDLLHYFPSKTSEILELFVQPKYRGKNIGTLLMNRIEKYFQNSGCDILKTRVFVPNKGGYEFYKKLGFKDRGISLIKELSIV